MRFLPKQSRTSFTQMYSGEPPLETYIDKTKTNRNKKLPMILRQEKQNLPQNSSKLKKADSKPIGDHCIKPDNKHLGILIKETDDYLHLCTQQLADTHTYSQQLVSNIYLIPNAHKRRSLWYSHLFKNTPTYLHSIPLCVLPYHSIGLSRSLCAFHCTLWRGIRL